MIPYVVYLGVFCDFNPGPHGLAMIVTHGSNRKELGLRIADPSTTVFQAYIAAVDWALWKVDRPQEFVRIWIRALNLVQVLSKKVHSSHPAYQTAATLAARPLTSVTWLPRRDLHPQMDRAHRLAEWVLRNRRPIPAQ